MHYKTKYFTSRHTIPYELEPIGLSLYYGAQKLKRGIFMA